MIIIPKWLKLAKAEVGTMEMPGVGDNEKILGYSMDAGVSGVVNHDSVPWCAAFVGAMLKRGGLMTSGKANAKSYLDWGTKINGPVLGCVVVLDRPPHDWEGHVGFYLGRHLPGHVRLVGGNQGDMVCEADFDVGRVNQYRWPLHVAIEPEWVGPITVSGGMNVNPSDR